MSPKKIKMHNNLYSQYKKNNLIKNQKNIKQKRKNKNKSSKLDRNKIY